MTEQIEKPHTIKDFDAIAHDAFIRECAHEIIQANKSSIETVQKHVSQFKEKLKNCKQNQNNFKKAIRREQRFSALTSMIQRSVNGDSHA